MPIRVQCPGCSARFKAPDSYAGRSEKCPKCGAAVSIPAVPVDASDIALDDNQNISLNPSDVERILAEIDAKKNKRSKIEDPSDDPPRTLKQLYEYRMVQVPDAIVVEKRKGGEAARYLAEGVKGI